MEQISKVDKIGQLMNQADKKVLSVYYTAGFPDLGSTSDVAKYLEESGADLIEIGIPYSDPVADGPTIQRSNQQALSNGMTVETLMQQLDSFASEITIPIILMGYLNPILQYGLERFCRDCSQRGVSGLIIPDLPINEYLENYQEVFMRNQLKNVFLITPQTSDERIRWIDKNTDGFIYAVSDSSITGAKSGISPEQLRYFERLRDMNLENPYVIGFGISDKETFSMATKYAKGAIIGSAFINVLTDSSNIQESIHNFIHSVKG